MVDNDIREDIRRVGGLAAIDFEREGSPISPDQLGTLIGHFDKIQELSRLAKSTESKSVPAPLREDVVEPSLDQEQILANVPAAENGYIKIKTIINS